MLLAFNIEPMRRRKGLTPGERVPCWMGVKWKPEENVKVPDLLTRHNDYLQALVQQKEVELVRVRADKDAEIAQLHEEVRRLQAKLAPPPSPPPAPPKPKDKHKQAAPSISPEEYARYLERTKPSNEPLSAEDAELVAKLTSLGGYDATSADAP